MSDDSKNTLKIRCPSCTQKLDVSGVPPFSTIKCPQCSATITVPRRFGALLLEELIGEGKVSKVYRALDTTLDREAAVKVAKKSFRENAAEGAVFLAEAKKMAVLIHPRIVPIYSCGEAEDQAYLAMQYLAGQSVAARLPGAKNGLPVESCLAHALFVTQGLEAAFHKGILHHNVCPANILIDADGEAKIGDFGLACAAWNEGRDLRENLRACFSLLAYASPEKGLTGKEDVRGDIYSLGATLYHMLTGRAPFFGENTEEAFLHRLVESPLPPRALQSDIPESLDGLVLDMMAGKPEDRPQTYAEVLAALGICRRSMRGKRPVPAGQRRRAAPGMPVGGVAAMPKRPAILAAPVKPAATIQPRHDPGMRLAILLLLLLLAGLAMVGAVQRKPWYVENVEPVIGSFKAWLIKGPPRSRPPLKVRPAASPNAPAKADEETGGVPADSQSSERSRPSPERVADDAALPASPVGDGAELTGDGIEDAVAATTDPPEPEPVGQDSPPLAAPVPAPPPEPPGRNRPSAKAPEYLAARPRPQDLDFFRIEEGLKAYLKKVPAEAQETEKERIRIISTIRADLIRLFRFPYEDAEHGVKLRNGTTVHGSLMGNENELIVKPKNRSKFRELKWSDLAFEQYPACLEFYILQRLDRANPAGAKAEEALDKALGGLSGGTGQAKSKADEPAARRHAAAYDYFRLALLCDWYNSPKEARRYAGLAPATDPVFAEEIARFLPGIAEASVSAKAR